ncbi:MAG: stage sporulation protein [Petroclostridium sp.]|jgi:stage V sporulation protein AC|uniref:stage V sporulation protein AC n=1 Tax=Petroclostridium xylanilyticum TaxID=1792311 RepID=UPI000B98BD02|nr:stage V sporulation protein AC [Petroclostridium xylanilyticum]MBZ4644682.1 stage sporulation protein [Clostridia bacterium]MDK2810547.1 stage sporulation protein [Petroclostridium sp.]
MEQLFTKKEYEKYVQKKSPNSPIVKNTIMAFVVGGLICIVGQIISNYFKSRGLNIEQTAGATAILMVLLGALFTGLDLYDSLAKYAGAGTIVPITGFANAIVSPAIEFKSEGYILGVASKMFVIAGPVLVYGITASIVAGIIYFLVGLR